MDRSEGQNPGERDSINSVLQWRGKHQSEQPAFIFLSDGEREALHITYGELDRRTRSVAAWLQERKLAGKPVVLLYRPGLDFIFGFLGCLYAGAIAVPAYPPHPRRSDARLQSIMDDCRAQAAFCSVADHQQLVSSLTGRGLEVIATDALPDRADQWQEHHIELDALAHLQYTSGSTGNPKGVMVSHGNLLHQCEYVSQISLCTVGSVQVSWQPFFHDMGLIGSVMGPTFCGATTVIMSPAAFLQSPIRWLRAITKYRATGTISPNFAYDLCVRGTTPEQREGLDLSTWKEAWNGAEPIRAETLDRFCEIYEPYGFSRHAHLPCYGMAETTLCTTASRTDRLPVVTSFRRDKLDQGNAEPCALDERSAATLVSSGIIGGDMDVAIVDPETRQRLPDSKVGEIWVSGPSVARGYWQRPEETEQAFNAHIAGENNPYLRTGDLGFLREGELYVTGRLKDMIIIRGRNLYPQDIELVAQRSHDALQIDACAAFAVDVDGREELAVAFEVRRSGRQHVDSGAVFAAVRNAIGAEFGVAVHWLGLVQPGRIPKTSSGKIMRHACLREHLSGGLAVLAQWRSRTSEQRGSTAAVSGLIELLRELPQADRQRMLVAHVQNEIARTLELDALPDPRTGFERLGLDSMGAVELVNRLQDAIGNNISLPATLLFDQPNIEAVARYLDENLFAVPAQPTTSNAVERPLAEPVAIVGLACRFPGASDADAFWTLLEAGGDAIQEVPSNRWDIDTYFDADPATAGKMNSRFGGFIDEIEGFDAAFFDISPREATSMDPQHRHLLEVSWLALEDAAIAPGGLDGRPIGVFMGISTGDYEQILASSGAEATDAFMATGNAHSAAVGRLSFALGLQGPCVAVDTACSSSLVAVHQAVQSLRQGECELALAGGVNAILRPELTVAFCKARLLSPDGRCKTFDAAADGYVRSEGCGVVVLKRLSDAVRDADRILAVIRGSAVNQDGRSSGLTAPNGPAQTRVIASALSMADVDPARVQYLECHGTATVLGDPIEVQAANAILSRGRAPEHPLVIGSVKSNIGHLEAAAGIAGLIKVVLSLQHRKIPRSLHFQTPNPHIPWGSMPVHVAAETLPWQSSGLHPRIAGVSSFGFAGTNAHVVLEEAPPAAGGKASAATEEDGTPYLLTLSARTEAGLKALTVRYAAWLRTRNSIALSELCHTANTGRNHFEHRTVVICDSRDTTQAALDNLARGEAAAGAVSGVAARERRPRVAFLFPGQGLQYAGMARELYERAPAFRLCLDRCAEAYDEFGRDDGSPPLKTIMFDSASTALLKQTRYVQPALYALQVSLAALWEGWGVKPDALLGHSAGEYAAACVAGVFRVEDGLRLIVERARLMQDLPAGGTMLSVTAPAETVETALAGDTSAYVSAYNGLNTVISGPVERLEALAALFDAQELYYSKLPASNAFHSPAIDPILDAFEACARRIEYSVPRARLISTLTGKPIGAREVPDAAYWRSQARNPVRFAQGIQALFEDVGCDIAIELGPQAELVWLAQMSWRPEHKVIWTSSLAKGRDAYGQMLAAAAQLHANGVTLDLARMDTRAPRRKLALPSYPFQHASFWPGQMGGSARELQDCFFRLRWHARDGGAPRPAAGQLRSWLIVADEADVAAALAAALRNHGQTQVAVADIQQDKGSDVSIAAAVDAARRQGSLDQVVLIAGRAASRDPDPDAMWDAQSHGVVRALLLAQALLATRDNAQLWLVTRGTQAVRDGDAVDPTHAAIWGFGRTFAIEHPDRCGGLIDLAPTGTTADVVGELAHALLCDDSEKQAALRNGQRWLPRLERYSVPESAPVAISASASYLITGGTGALGVAVARHLARRGAGQIVLTSRSGADRSTEEALRELRARGCRVEIIRADLGLREDTERLMDEIQRITRDHPLRGIIFAAGTHSGAPILQQTPETLRKVLAPKVSGAWNLHHLCLHRGIHLDLFVLFSSGASLLGSRHHANYTASNAYLDSLAHYRRSAGLSALSINWGPWAGFGVAPQMQGASWEDLGMRLIRPATGMRAFDRLAGGQDIQVSMQPLDLSRWVTLAHSGRIPPILMQLLESLLPSAGEAQGTAADSAQPQLPARRTSEFVERFARSGAAERRAALQALIRERVGAVLGIPADQVDADAGFFDLGMNSIMAVELRGALEARLGKLAQLQAAVVFNHPTVRRLSTHLAGVLFPAQEEGQTHARPAPIAPPSAAQSLDSASLPEAIEDAAAQVLGATILKAKDGDSDEDARMRKAYAAILALRAEVHALRSSTTDPIAIVGLSCRYPGADSAAAYWQLLAEGRDEIKEVPADRWEASLYYDPDPDTPGKMNSQQGGFVAGIDGFDAGFFGISPREARSMDPQQRLLLEVSWEALESANLAPRRLRESRGGIFVGITAADYAQRVVALGIDSIDAYAGTGNALCAAAGRLAFTLGWQGPALAIDTACSSSLVALHEACSSLRAGECEIALAGGVNLILDPAVSITLSKAHALSPDDRCKTFDASANGYVRSEGCGIVVLKRLSDAERDGNRILALVRGSAVNQDGRSSGLTVPNGLAQERVITDALKVAGVEPAAVQYLEAHGTGTPLGDPIEVQAANQVLSRGRSPETPLLLGSVKTNFGHTEAASGIGSIIKVVLALQNETLPKSLHFKQPNPHIPWDDMKVKVVAEPMPWPRGQTRRIAGVSSFGFVGTNAHVVLEEAPTPVPVGEADPVPQVPERGIHLLALSARSEQSLTALARRYSEHVASVDGVSLGDLCWSANTARDHFEHRAALVFDERNILRAQLGALEGSQQVPGLVQGRVALGSERRIAFLFTGQGSQYVGMGCELYRTEPVFREHFDRCAEEFARLRPDAPDLRKLVFDGAGDGLIDQTGYTQPALYALEVSLAALWQRWGVEPDMVLGHSVGEYAAACVAGVFGIEDGLRLVVERGRLMQALPAGGAMAAVSAAAEKVEDALHGRRDVCIAAFNGVETVISGTQAQVDELIEQFTAQGERCRRLATSHAFHSALMDPMLDEFRTFAAGVSCRAPEKRFISNIDGNAIAAGHVLDAEYWTMHIRRPVKFARGIQALQALRCDVMLEIGPHPVLATAGQACWDANETPLWLGSLRRSRREPEQMLNAAAALHATGVRVDFAVMDAPWRAKRRSVNLPLYPFQRQRFWIDLPQSKVKTAPGPRDGIYTTTWMQKPVANAAGQGAVETWLILGDSGGMAQALGRRLEELGQRCIRLGVDQQAGGSPLALASLLARTGDQSSAPITRVVHLRSLDTAPVDSTNGLRAAQGTGVESVLELLQVLLGHGWHGKLWLVTRGVQRVTEHDRVEPAQSPMWGMGKAIAMEQPQLWGGLVDLPIGGETTATVTALAEILQAQDEEDRVALRDGCRWVARVERSESTAGAGTPQFTADGTYLITGGLGGVGLEMARRLAARGARHLVLIGRGMPSEFASEVIRKLAEDGCEVRAMQCDVSSAADLDRLFDAIDASGMPPLKGVIHAAGTGSLVPLEALDLAELRRTLEAKVVGGWLLDRLTRERKMDLSFFLCTSSIASAWGAVSQAAYAAANAFLEALAESRNARGDVATTISYGPWARTGLMASATESGVAWLRRRGLRPLSPSVALDAMEKLVAGNVPIAAVADVDWSAFRAHAETQRVCPWLERLGDKPEASPETTSAQNSPPTTEQLDKIRNATGTERIQLLAATIRREVAYVLGVNPDSLQDDTSILELGLDSLMAVDLINRLRRQLSDTRFSPRLIYENPTVAELAAALDREIVVANPGASNAVPLQGYEATSTHVGPTATGPQVQSEQRYYRIKDCPDRPFYTSRPYRDGDKAAVLGTFAQCFGQNAANILATVFDWKYLDRSLTGSQEPALDILDCGGQVVGMNGGIRARFRLGDTTLPGIWSCDLHVLPEHREATAWFMQRVNEDAPGITLGMPNAAVYPLLSASESVVDLDRYVNLKSCLDLGSVLRLRGSNTLLCSVSGAVFSPVPRAFEIYAALRAERGIRTGRIQRFDSRFDQLWQTVAPGYTGIMVRDYAFLSWRFDRFPGDAYMRYTAERGGNLAGYIVTRDVSWGGARRGRVVDFLVGRGDAAAFDCLIQRAMKEFRSRGVVSVSFPVSSTQKDFIRRLRKHGFLHTAQGPRVIANRGLHDESIAASNDWFFTLADADADYNNDDI